MTHAGFVAHVSIFKKRSHMFFWERTDRNSIDLHACLPWQSVNNDQSNHAMLDRSSSESHPSPAPPQARPSKQANRITHAMRRGHLWTQRYEDSIVAMKVSESRTDRHRPSSPDPPAPTPSQRERLARRAAATRLASVKPCVDTRPPLSLGMSHLGSRLKKKQLLEGVFLSFMCAVCVCRGTLYSMGRSKPSVCIPH